MNDRPRCGPLAVLLCPLILGTAPSARGQVEIVALSLQSGETRVVAAGDLEKAIPEGEATTDLQEAGGWGPLRWFLSLLVLGGGGYWARRLRQR